MKNFFYLHTLLLAVATLWSCQAEEDLQQQSAPKVNVACSIQSFSDNLFTRTAYSQDESQVVKITWREGDRIAVFPEEGSTVDFTIAPEDVGKEKATFTGGYFMPRKNVKYYALYPFMDSMLEEGQSKNQVTLHYENFAISNWDSMEHLGTNDYMVAGPCQVNNQYELEFNFKHINSLMLLKVKLPADASYNKFELSGTENLLVSRATIDLTAESPQLTPVQYTNCMSVKLGKDSKGLEGKKGQEVCIYMMLPPQDLSGKTLYLKLYNTDGTSYIARFQGFDLHQGSAYDYSKTTGVVDMTEVSPNHRWVFISDIHVGDKRSVDNGYSWHNEMREPFINFLKYMKANGERWDDMIIVGDLVDEWVCPANMKPMADANNKTLTSREFFGQIVKDNSELFQQFTDLSKSHHLHYVSGNHDMQVEKEDFETYLPGVFEHHYDGKGLGSMLIDDIIWVEHGHRYDVYNAPFLDRNGSIGKSMIPPGYFVSRLVTKKNGTRSASWNGIPGHMTMDGQNTQPQTRGMISCFTLGFLAAINFGGKGAPELYEEGGRYDILCDGQDGLGESYYWDWTGGNVYWTEPNNVEEKYTLYRDPSDEDAWTDRCKRNGTKYVPFLDSVLGGNFYSYFDYLSVHAMNERNARICVFGHSHSPKLEEYDLGGEYGPRKMSLYANSGCWVDNSVISEDDFTGSWVEIDRSEFDGMKTYTLKLFQYDIENNQPILKGEKSMTITKEGKVVGDDTMNFPGNS